MGCAGVRQRHNFFLKTSAVTLHVFASTNEPEARFQLVPEADFLLVSSLWQAIADIILSSPRVVSSPSDDCCSHVSLAVGMEAGKTVSLTPALAICGDLMVVTGGTHLLAARYTESTSNDDLFTYDCTTASKKPQENQGENAKSPGKGSHDILACAFSISGTYFALTDDSKRLVLFRTKPSWECLSIRTVVRRCTSLVITAAEDKILVADKSGDVYSYSISDPEKSGIVELGHLSLLLDVVGNFPLFELTPGTSLHMQSSHYLSHFTDCLHTVVPESYRETSKQIDVFSVLSPDDQYILTADRDEKIRVSLTKAPHNILSFCLGHREFVSRIFVIPNYPDLLLSASGDCTLRLWEYKTGKEVYCCHLSNLDICEATKNDMKYTVTKIAYYSEGSCIAVLYDCVPTVSIFQLDASAQNLSCKQHISLNHKGWDVAFETTGGLWVLQENMETPLLFYQPVGGQWQLATEEKALRKMSNYIHENWTILEGSVGRESSYQNLYKASFDNMAVYLQKKEERLQQQKNKRKGFQPESNGEMKKIRTGTPSL